MGIARLLAKGWIAFCLFAGAHALWRADTATPAALQSVPGLVVSVLLFAAMGLLFTGGYGISARDGNMPLLERLKPHHLLPGFNAAVFVAFALMSFIDQIALAPRYHSGVVVDALEGAVAFVTPSQNALAQSLAACSLDGGRVFAYSVAWLLALVFLASALSRLRLSAGLLRLERNERPEVLGPVVHAAVLGIAALVGFQLLFMGTAFSWLGCNTLRSLPGNVLIGLGPLMLCYLILSALTSLLAVGPES
ncbi:MAG TPA: hypothetical protein VK779_02495 [Rhizomicrobium sp.]|jgi:hypothetical protein|nr:hypothetical protein [Rhizomicrobium sp.]